MRWQSRGRWSDAAKALPQRATTLVRTVAAHILEDAQTSMSGPKSGAVYGSHQASGPGEPPAIDTGTLVNSGYMEPQGPYAAEVGFTAEHADYMEHGTVFIAPRPFLGPAFDRAQDEFERGMEGLLR